MDIVISILRGVSVGAGVLLFLAGLLIYETEARQIHSLLETWWLKVGELQAQGVSRRAAFARVVAERCAAIVNAAYGEKLISVRAVAASASLSLASIFLAAGLIGPFWPGSKTNPGLVTFALMFGIIFLVGPLAMYEASGVWKSIVAWIILAAYGLFWSGVLLTWTPSSGQRSVGPAAVAAGTSLLGNMLFLVSVRWLVLTAARAASFWRIVGFAAINLPLAALLGPAAVILTFLLPFPKAVYVEGFAPGMWMNSLNSLAAVLFLFVALGMLMHALFWPVLARLLYPFASSGLFDNKKLLFGISAALMGLGYKPLAEFVKSFL